MGAGTDEWIEKMAAEKGMIEPFAKGQVSKGVISFGVSSYGYDVRLSEEFKVLNPGCRMLDPKAAAESFSDYRGTSCIIQPNSFVLGMTVEYFRIPRNVIAICLGKSSYARCGIIANVTPLEPEWEGRITISISNTSPVPAKIYAGEGIAQVVFLENENSPGVSYADKKGRYQAQKSVTPTRV